MDFGLKDGIFCGLFIFLLIYVLKTSKAREDRLYNFLDAMKQEFAKLVGSYERLSDDVTHIRNELDEIKQEK